MTRPDPDRRFHSPDGPQRADAAGLPAALKSDLSALYRPPAGIPPEADEEIHYRARRAFGDFRRSRRWGRVAVAAALALMVLGLEFVLQHRPGPAPARRDTFVQATPAGLPEDIDGSGRVDILDALALARRLESGGLLPTRWDLDADGRIDRRDVDAVAHRAVRLSGGDS